MLLVTEPSLAEADWDPGLFEAEAPAHRALHLSLCCRHPAPEHGGGAPAPCNVDQGRAAIRPAPLCAWLSVVCFTHWGSLRPRVDLVRGPSETVHVQGHRQAAESAYARARMSVPPRSRHSCSGERWETTPQKQGRPQDLTKRRTEKRDRACCKEPCRKPRISNDNNRNVEEGRQRGSTRGWCWLLT